jgi:hypothetical protein
MRKKKKKNLDSSAIVFYPDGNLFERKGERVRTRNEEMNEWMRKDLSSFFFFFCFFTDVLPSCSHDSALVNFISSHYVKRCTIDM